MTNKELADYLNRVIKTVTQLGEIVASMAAGIVDEKSNEDAYKVTWTKQKKDS